MKFSEMGEWGGKKNKIVLGYDLGSEFSQISYYVMGNAEPETVSVITGEQQYNFPTVLGKRLEVNQWVYGKEALQLAQDGEGVLVDNLVKLAREGEQVEVGGSSFDPVALLALFMKKSLNLLFSWVLTISFSQKKTEKKSPQGTIPSLYPTFLN